MRSVTLKDLRDGTHRTLAARYVLDATETGELLHLAGVEHANGAESRATACPLADLALGRIVFPTAPLPPGMTDPRAAVDGDAGTAWSPGPDGRMVVDLDAEQHITEIRTQWRGGHAPASQVEFSRDGRTYGGAAQLSARGVLRTDSTPRDVALRVITSSAGPTSLIALTIA
ncbi:hypothetical protein AQJ43_31485 [Streptomyces avermitilis]|uniref:F5/8 type C domain-containing protein n=1 Tax=Streptomyces avermitilis (strain ATCC 31267 / DSM 46492 / JCM 5070 / NBRC 14893 / NCIMB 12804 / NRRL 8165 / MA-4680) TaxID=227882 RepID=Q82Q88_STRAW|nr:hypothetical protein AQJ43_31485 [Streptomyces avermitilis]OOV16707.1 hypothetical protein SM007_38115 [Streptomyces avermitilis]BAC68342.1 hypothetical protein SAVERM_631 [Streptomyces avermitilis MA-4680 = NBRC 14893]